VTMAHELTEQSMDEIFSRFKGKRAELIPILQATQEKFGFLPEDALRQVARFLSVAESKVYGAATFYAQFYFTPRGRHTITVCCGTACHVKGASLVLDALERELGVSCGGTTPDFKYNLQRVACVGSCVVAPVVLVDDKLFGPVEVGKIKECLAVNEGGKQ